MGLTISPDNCQAPCKRWLRCQYRESLSHVWQNALENGPETAFRQAAIRLLPRPGRGSRPESLLGACHVRDPDAGKFGAIPMQRHRMASIVYI